MEFKKHFITIGILGASVVALGAFGAHGLKNQVSTGLISPDQLNGFDTGVKYQMYHTLAMLLLIALQNKLSLKFFKWTWNLFLVGIILFSGSLYFLTTRNLYGMEFLTFLGPITPIGGICFMAGWIMFAVAGFKSSKQP